MDFLASLSLTNVPEQQTRTSHNPEIIEALSSNPNIQLGFDACCYCGKSIEESEAISCPKCKRVSYCSDRCRKLDSQPSSSYLQEEFDTEAPPSNANGHGSVICALLRLCNQDEDEEEAMEQENPKFNLSDKNKNKKTTSRKQEEARDRVRSEYESYPATLANLLMDGPCYQPMLQKCSASTKNNHSHNNGNGNGGDSEGLSLTIHIIGASNEAELWNANASASANGRKKALSRVFDSYAEALTDLAENYSIPSINLVFVGPDCPEKLRASRTLKLSSSSTSEKTKQQKKTSLSESRLSFYTHASMYNASFLQQLSSENENENENLSKPDVIVFFNPGFTCPDYNWEDVLQNLPSKKNSSSTPFLITTNTEMEAVLDCQYLLERQCISSLPPMIQAMIDAETGDMNESDKSPGHYDNDNDNDIEEEEEDGENYVESNDGMFFGENPYAGSRVRQSGTMANDVYVKSMWMFGGASLSPMVTASKPQKKRKESSAKKSNSQNNGGDSKEQDKEIRHEKKKRKKTHKVIGKGNSKKKNPALL